MPTCTDLWSGGEVPLMNINRHAENMRDQHGEAQAQALKSRHWSSPFFLPAAGAFGPPPFL